MKHFELEKSISQLFNALKSQSLVCDCFFQILDLQSIPQESNNKDVVAMLVELTIGANK